MRHHDHGTVIVELLGALILVVTPAIVFGNQLAASIGQDFDHLVAYVVGAGALWKFVIAPLQRMDRRASHVPGIMRRLGRIEEHIGLQPLEETAGEDD